MLSPELVEAHAKARALMKAVVRDEVRLAEAERTFAAMMPRLASLPSADVGELCYYLLLVGLVELAGALLGAVPEDDGNFAPSQHVLGLIAAGKIVEATYTLGAGIYHEGCDRSTEAELRAFIAGLGPDSVVVDCACGTGLFGREARRCGFAGTLIGVDLTPAMLRQALGTRTYNQLVCADALAYLASPKAEFDHCVCIGLLYFLTAGQVEAFIGGVGRKLAPGGTFAFNFPVRQIPGDPELPHGRHAHDLATVAQALSRAGFEQQAIAGEPGYPVIRCRKVVLPAGEGV